MTDVEFVSILTMKSGSVLTFTAAPELVVSIGPMLAPRVGPVWSSRHCPSNDSGLNVYWPQSVNQYWQIWHQYYTKTEPVCRSYMGDYFWYLTLPSSCCYHSRVPIITFTFTWIFGTQRNSDTVLAAQSWFNGKNWASSTLTFGRPWWVDFWSPSHLSNCQIALIVRFPFFSFCRTP